MTTQLSLKGVTRSYGHRLVLDQLTFSVRPGERAGIVGENGSGKSTLLRLIAGVDVPDDGEVTVSAAGGVGYLGQTLDLPGDHTVQQAVDAALAELRALERGMQRAAEAEDMATYGELLTVFEARGGYGADARVDKAMYGLGLAHIDRSRVLSSLSGGERARLGLACLLAASPEILLLDEPTNHLDEAATTWLEERLRDHPGTVVVVSHDRVFLDRVTTAILEVEGGTITRFGGGYSGFLAEKAAARQRWEQAYADWREEIRRVTEFAATTAQRVAQGRPMTDNNKMAYDRNAGRVQSSVASRVRQAQERLRRLEADPVPRPPEPLRFRGVFAGTVGAERTLVELRDLHVEGRLHVASLTIGARDRLLVEGDNGAGKSTLLRAIHTAAGSRAGYLPQEVDFRPGRTTRETYPGEPEALLATGLFHPEALDLDVAQLSVGQRRRLALAVLLAGEYELLLLDEPTNHLSLALAEELEQALDGFGGALVVVTHDRALRQRFNGRRISLSGGRIC
ncbi:ATP-binding cassette domain-containing protein [Micromonospora sp. DR5-3]|uniref:ABC-F family ATP-binding cassette domain-containing protein n=1 Tax=unclassified Micromonospora TaxID=2617518 RepID=UPI0011DAE923|nr:MULTISPECIES: ABC-F family ATP-binding cassette domain-containing protein [unclassified Micromonospora]MCW3819105.1 ATP-binding cassette domain-containing protein [Micromonospora sp. DR5-3]TYC21849.1 ABC-F family ATP-binding cassette domain-containing protein [Micromonospora sp. MP36]